MSASLRRIFGSSNNVRGTNPVELKTSSRVGGMHRASPETCDELGAGPRSLHRSPSKENTPPQASGKPRKASKKPSKNAKLRKARHDAATVKGGDQGAVHARKPEKNEWGDLMQPPTFDDVTEIMDTVEDHQKEIPIRDYTVSDMMSEVMSKVSDSLTLDESQKAEIKSHVEKYKAVRDIQDELSTHKAFKGKDDSILRQAALDTYDERTKETVAASVSSPISAPAEKKPARVSNAPIIRFIQERLATSLRADKALVDQGNAPKSEEDHVIEILEQVETRIGKSDFDKGKVAQLTKESLAYYTAMNSEIDSAKEANAKLDESTLKDTITMFGIGYTLTSEEEKAQMVQWAITTAGGHRLASKHTRRASLTGIEGAGSAGPGMTAQEKELDALSTIATMARQMREAYPDLYGYPISPERSKQDARAHLFKNNPEDMPPAYTELQLAELSMSVTEYKEDIGTPPKEELGTYKEQLVAIQDTKAALLAGMKEDSGYSPQEQLRRSIQAFHNTEEGQSTSSDILAAAVKEANNELSSVSEISGKDSVMAHDGTSFTGDKAVKDFFRASSETSPVERGATTSKRKVSRGSLVRSGAAGLSTLSVSESALRRDLAEHNKMFADVLHIERQLLATPELAPLYGENRDQLRTDAVQIFKSANPHAEISGDLLESFLDHRIDDTNNDVGHIFSDDHAGDSVKALPAEELSKPMLTAFETGIATIQEAEGCTPKEAKDKYLEAHPEFATFADSLLDDSLILPEPEFSDSRVAPESPHGESATSVSFAPVKEAAKKRNSMLASSPTSLDTVEEHRDEEIAGIIADAQRRAKELMRREATDNRSAFRPPKRKLPNAGRPSIAPGSLSKEEAKLLLPHKTRGASWDDFDPRDSFPSPQDAARGKWDIQSMEDPLGSRPYSKPSSGHIEYDAQSMEAPFDPDAYDALSSRRIEYDAQSIEAPFDPDAYNALSSRHIEYDAQSMEAPLDLNAYDAHGINAHLAEHVAPHSGVNPFDPMSGVSHASTARTLQESVLSARNPRQAAINAMQFRLGKDPALIMRSVETGDFLEGLAAESLRSNLGVDELNAEEMAAISDLQYSMAEHYKMLLEKQGTGRLRTAEQQFMDTYMALCLGDHERNDGKPLFIEGVGLFRASSAGRDAYLLLTKFFNQVQIFNRAGVESIGCATHATKSAYMQQTLSADLRELCESIFGNSHENHMHSQQIEAVKYFIEHGILDDTSHESLMESSSVAKKYIHTLADNWKKPEMHQDCMRDIIHYQRMHQGKDKTESWRQGLNHMVMSIASKLELHAPHHEASGVGRHVVITRTKDQLRRGHTLGAPRSSASVGDVASSVRLTMSDASPKDYVSMGFAAGIEALQNDFASKITFRAGFTPDNRTPAEEGRHDTFDLMDVITKKHGTLDPDAQRRLLQELQELVSDGGLVSRDEILECINEFEPTFTRNISYAPSEQESEFFAYESTWTAITALFESREETPNYLDATKGYLANSYIAAFEKKDLAETREQLNCFVANMHNLAYSNPDLDVSLKGLTKRVISELFPITPGGVSESDIDAPFPGEAFEHEAPSTRNWLAPTIAAPTSPGLNQANSIRDLLSTYGADSSQIAEALGRLQAVQRLKSTDRPQAFKHYNAFLDDMCAFGQAYPDIAHRLRELTKDITYATFPVSGFTPDTEATKAWLNSTDAPPVAAANTTSLHISNVSRTLSHYMETKMDITIEDHERLLPLLSLNEFSELVPSGLDDAKPTFREFLADMYQLSEDVPGHELNLCAIARQLTDQLYPGELFTTDEADFNAWLYPGPAT